MALKRVNIAELSELFVKNNLEANAIFERIVFEKICSKWEEIVGPMLAKNIYPKQYSNRKLVLTATHPAYKQEVAFINEKILKDINSYFNQIVLEKIIFNSFFVTEQKSLKKNKADSKKVK